MAATGATLSGSLAGIVNDIRTRAVKYSIQSGVCKALVTPVGVGSKGNKVTEPAWNPTARNGTAGTEATDFTGFTSYTSATVAYSATEWVHGTLLSYNSIEDASESVRDENARMHAQVHAKKIEQKICAVFASFSNSVTATSTSGLSIAKVAAAKAQIENEAILWDGDKSLVLSPTQHYYLWADLANDSTFGVQGSTGDRLLDKYYAGTLLGDVNTYISQTGISAATNQVGGMFVKSAIGLFMPRMFQLEYEQNISLRAYELVSTHRAGARRRNATGGVKVTAYGIEPS